MSINQRIFDWLCTLERKEFQVLVRVLFLSIVLPIYVMWAFWFDSLDAYVIHIFMVGLFTYQSSSLADGLWEHHLSMRTGEDSGLRDRDEGAR